MITMAEQHPQTSPMRLMEMLSDRFGAFEAIANSTIKLARFVSEEELPMDPLVAEAVLEFASDLRSATAASGDWARAKGFALPRVLDDRSPEEVISYDEFGLPS